VLSAQKLKNFDAHARNPEPDALVLELRRVSEHLHAQMRLLNDT